MTVSLDRLLEVKKKADRGWRPPPPQPSAFGPSGHLPKEGKCHCGFDQTCSLLICGKCHAQRNHNAIMILTPRPDKPHAYWLSGYRHCKCGAHDWMYACEVGRVTRRQN